MISTTKTDGCWTLVLDRPEKANALTEDMLRDLTREVLSAQEAGVQVLVLTGAGKVFSAGADLEAAKAGLAVSDAWEELSAAIAGFPGLTVAALNGTVAGGAFGMVIACDIRVCVPDAKFFYPVMKLGYLPQPSDPKRLSDLVGPSRAKMILMAGQKIKAQEALTWGLVDRVVDAETLTTSAQELIEDALAAKADHVWAIKSLLVTR